MAATLRDTTALTPADAFFLQARLAAEDFVEFVRQVYPWLILEETHIALARHLEACEAGEMDRFMCAVAPRTGKSTFISVLFPGWWIGRHPDHTIMIASHSESLAGRFGDELIALIRSEVYARIFPNVILRKASSKDFTIASTTHQRLGRVICVGVGSAIAGNGFHLGIIDDAISEQDAESDLKKDRAELWFRNGFYTRRNPDFNVILHAGTRWAYDDLTGRLIDMARADPAADQYTILSIPAILDATACRLLTTYAMTDADLSRDVQVKVGGSFAPRRHDMKEIMRSKATLTERSFSAQYMGRPSVDDGTIIKKSYWRKWPKVDRENIPIPPVCIEIILCYDTAFEEDEANDPSAMTAWGVFESQAKRQEDSREYEHRHAILLGAWEEHIDAADLLPRVKRDREFFRPDRIMVEKRASGIQLIQECRRARIPVSAWLPPGPPGAKGKRPRAHAASIPMSQGCVWYMPGSFADDVIEQSARYPYGARDDLLDTVTMMMIYLRRRWHLNIITDEPNLAEEKQIVYEARRKAFTSRRLYGRPTSNRSAQDKAIMLVVEHDK